MRVQIRTVWALAKLGASRTVAASRPKARRLAPPTALRGELAPKFGSEEFLDMVFPLGAASGTPSHGRPRPPGRGSLHTIAESSNWRTAAAAIKGPYNWAYRLTTICCAILPTAGSAHYLSSSTWSDPTASGWACLEPLVKRNFCRRPRGLRFFMNQTLRSWLHGPATAVSLAAATGQGPRLGPA